MIEIHIVNDLEWWPDCKEGIVMAINSKFPGPTIDAVAGDAVIIHLKNKLSTEGVVIHWHGIRQGHQLEVVEADGNYVAPFTVDDIDIYPGETYSVLLRTHSFPSKKHFISVGVRGRKPNTTQVLTVLSYVDAPEPERPTLPPPVTPRWDYYNRSKSFSNKL